MYLSIHPSSYGSDARVERHSLLRASDGHGTSATGLTKYNLQYLNPFLCVEYQAAVGRILCEAKNIFEQNEQLCNRAGDVFQYIHSFTSS